MKRKIWMISMALIAAVAAAAPPPAVASPLDDCGQPCSNSMECGFCTICVSNMGNGPLLGRHCEG